MSTIATTVPRKGPTPVQMSMFLQFLSAMAWSFFLQLVFHSQRVVFTYLMSTWITAIALQPALPLPWWRMIASTLAAAVLVSGIFYLFSRLGWP